MAKRRNENDYDRKIIRSRKRFHAHELRLLLFRIGLGLAMFFNHGSDKLIHFEFTPRFPDPLGIGVTTSLVLVTFAETVGAVLLAIGFLTRFAAMTLVIDLAVAVFMVHKAASGAGELAFIYLIGYIALLLAGGGKFSADKALFGKGGIRPHT